jgi:ankyrin repeat protein
MRGLLEIGADPNYRNNGRDTALLIAVAASGPDEAPADPGRAGGGEALRRPDAREAAVAVLLQHGADPSTPNRSGVSPFKATRADDAAIVSLLMAYGGTWQLTDEDIGRSRQAGAPLDRVAIAEDLIRRGADINGHDFGGRTVLDYTNAGPQHEVTAVLRAHGARD